MSRVALKAPTGELLSSPKPDGKEQPSLTLHRYGVGVDCHSRFFQVCALIPEGTAIVKVERKVPATWPELRAAKAWLLRTLGEHDIAISPSDSFNDNPAPAQGADARIDMVSLWQSLGRRWSNSETVARTRPTLADRAGEVTGDAPDRCLRQRERMSASDRWR